MELKLVNRTLLGLTLAVAMAATSASASSNRNFSTSEIQSIVAAQSSIMKVKVGDWKVGDNTFHQFMYKAMELATMEWTVFKDEGTSIWVRHIWTNPDGTKDRVEELVDKETGKTLKYIRNGKEEEVPAEGNPIKVISSKDTTVTVPAGTFAAKLMVTESDELGVADTWQNEQEIPLSGVLKVVFYKSANRLKITMQLVEFTKM